MLEFEIKRVKCDPSVRGSEFTVVAFPISEERNQSLWKQATEYYAHIQALPLDPSGRLRNKEALVKTRYLGAISELVIAEFLRAELGDIVEVAREEVYQGYEKHTDIVLTSKQNNTKLTIEVRSSFAFREIEKAICSRLSVIGPYSTSYKPGEKEKDFYLLVLADSRKVDFNPQAPHTVYFAGGAELGLLKSIGIKSDLMQDGASYIIIRPIAKARDAEEIVNIIRNKVINNM